MRRAYIVGTLVALVVHVLFGWIWSISGAVVAGAISRRLGPLVGASCMVLSWGLLVLYGFVVAPGETAEMARVVSALLGNLPAPVTVALTLFVAATLGLAGGWLGMSLRRLVEPEQKQKQKQK